MPIEALLFFSVHAGADEHHANELHRAITRIDPSSSEWDEICSAAQQTSKNMYNFFDQVALYGLQEKH